MDFVAVDRKGKKAKKPPVKSWADVHSDDEDEDDLLTAKLRPVEKASPPSPALRATRDAAPAELAPAEPAAAPAQFDEWTTVKKKDKRKPKEPPMEPKEQAKEPLRPAKGPESRAGPPAPGKEKATVQVGLEDTPGFRVAQRVIGPQGAHLKKITDRTGAVISLRGRGCPASGAGADKNAPLHLLINAAPKDMALAVELATALVEDVRAQHRAHKP